MSDYHDGVSLAERLALYQRPEIEAEDLSMEWDAFWAGLAISAIVCFLAVSVYLGGYDRKVMPAELEWSQAQEVGK